MSMDKPNVRHNDRTDAIVVRSSSTMSDLCPTGPAPTSRSDRPPRNVETSSANRQGNGPPARRETSKRRMTRQTVAFPPQRDNHGLEPAFLTTSDSVLIEASGNVATGARGVCGEADVGESAKATV
jgi:hypothetical protein